MNATADQLAIIIFVPLGACTCTYASFMDRAWEAITPWKDQVVVQVKDGAGAEGDDLGIVRETIVIPTTGQRFTSAAALASFLRDRLGTS